MTWEVRIKHFQYMTKFDGGFEEKHLCNYLSCEVTEAHFFHGITFFIQKS